MIEGVGLREIMQAAARGPFEQSQFPLPRDRSWRTRLEFDATTHVVRSGAHAQKRASALHVPQNRRIARTVQLFRNPGFAAAVGFGVAVNLTYYGIVFVLALYLQRVKGYSALEAGFAYLPLTATFFAINIWSGHLIGRIGARKPMLFGALIDAFGFALLSMLAADSSYWQMLPAFALLPAGMGLGVPAMTTTVLASVGRESSGIAGGVLNSARQAAGVIGVAVFGSLAGNGRENVVSALNIAAIGCVVLLLTAAVVVYFAIPKRATVARQNM